MRLPSRLVRRVASVYRHLAIRRTDTSVDGALTAARKTIDRTRFCLLVTEGESGSPHARVLQPWPVRDDLVVHLGTSQGSRKVAELRARGRGLVVFQDNCRGACVVLDCEIDVLDDERSRTRFFMPFWYAFWPQGPGSDGFCALRCRPRAIELWDGSRGITPEPYGLVAQRLELDHGTWQRRKGGTGTPV